MKLHSDPDFIENELKNTIQRSFNSSSCFCSRLKDYFITQNVELKTHSYLLYIKTFIFKERQSFLIHNPGQKNGKYIALKNGKTFL